MSSKSPTLERQTFRTNRSMEFFTEKELTMQLGYQKGLWPIILTKELIDNALDACEQAGVAPDVEVTVEAGAVSVRDNGPGLPAAVIQQSLDYMVRISDKSHYVSPTRGQLGNALKCLWAAPFVADGEHGKAEVHSLGLAHTIDVTLDHIAQEPRLEHAVDESLVKNGTFVKIYWPSVASYLEQKGSSAFYKAISINELIHHYAAFNPHANFSLTASGQSYRLERTDDNWQKWRPDMPTSAHWYSPERLRDLIAAYLAGKRKDITVRGFVSEFDGLSGSVKPKAITDKCDLTGASLSDLIEGNDLSSQKVSRLLLAMREEAREIKPKRLGILGEAHLRQHLCRYQFTDPGLTWYKKYEGVADRLPFVLELALGIYRSEGRSCPRTVIVGLNWSTVLKIPMVELLGLLGENRVDSFDPVAVVVHLACPQLDFTERGKGALDLPDEVKSALKKGIESICKAWKGAKRQADRENRVRERDLEELNKPKKKLSIKSAAALVMEEAYLKASDNGRLPAHARQIMYAARDLILALTGGEFYKNSASFTQGDLPSFVTKNPELTANWDVVFDARGRFVEPHTGRRTDLGTLEVRRYLGMWTDNLPNTPHPQLNHSCPTVGPENRYRFALFIEKEGFYPLLEATRVAERFDVAVMSTKGMSVTAARKLVDELSQKGVTILVVRDFDKHGFSIAHTLQTTNHRYQFESTPNVIDVGLRLTDVEEMGLQSEPVDYESTKVDPRENLRQSGATSAECGFLVSGRTYSGKWRGQRVELNAMTSDQFITWLESKLISAGVNKVTPPDEVLQGAYKRAWKIAAVQKAVGEAAASLSDDIAIPQGLHKQISEMINDTDLAWDEAVWNLVTKAEQAGAA